MKWRVELTVFLAGAILMGLEIAGGRLLTPAYGGSVYVWGSIIGIFLIALSLGYYFGGRLADARPHFEPLSYIIMLTAALILLIPFIAESIIKLYTGLPAPLSPFATALTLFLIPSILLGTVSPFAIRLRAKSIKGIGRLSGNLYALATLGSVIGTFATTFILILLLPMTAIFLLFSLILFILAIAIAKGRLLLSLAGVVLVLILLFLSGEQQEAGSPEGPVDLTIESLYGQIRVWDENGIRKLAVSGGKMSAMNLSDQYAPVAGWEYVECMEVAYLFEPGIEEMLTIGLGGGSFPKKVQKKFQTRVESVELNPTIVAVAEEYFFVEPSRNFKVHVADGRRWLQESEKQYDIIAVDVAHYDPLLGYQVPFHLVTQEFFELNKEHLDEAGVFVMNLPVEADNTFFLSVGKTIEAVFGNVHAFGCEECCQVLIATKEEQSMGELYEEHPDAAVLEAYFEMVPTAESIILRDEYAPLNPFPEALVR